MKKRQEIKGKEKARKPLPHIFKKMESRSEGISVPQKLVEYNALVRTEEWVTDREVSDLLEKEDSKGNFKIIREKEFGNPKVIATTHTEKGDKVEFVLEITSGKHGEKVSEILKDLGVVSEDLVGRVELIEMAHRVSGLTGDHSIAEGTIRLMLDRDVDHKEQYYSLVLDTLRPKNAIMPSPSQKRLFDESLRNPNFMSPDVDAIKDDCF